MTHVRTLILGGGMSGLSCAYHLKSDYQLWEKSNEPGGLSRSIKQDGFVFDHTGHLLHLHKPDTLVLIKNLLGDNLVERKRNAWIYSHNTYTRYPFQANTYGLPQPVIEECLKGLMEAQKKSKRESDKLPSKPPDARSTILSQNKRGIQTFRNWVEYTFGEGFGKHFFYPYNEKLWTVPAEDLTTEWMGKFVPKPSIEEVINGSKVDQTKEFGYNATFYYPREGGIQALAFAFARRLDTKNIFLNREVASIHLDKKQAVTKSGEVVSYDQIVSSIPLARFMTLTQPFPGDISGLTKQLRWTAVYNLNLGIRRPNLTDKHWIYFPEKKYRFYRVGFPMNFSDNMTPPGCSSMYIEIAHKPGEVLDKQEEYRRCIEGLLGCGLLQNEKEIISQLVLPIPIAYVIFDKHRTPAVEALLHYLQTKNVHSIGRFGAWKYSYMEEAILEGKATAEAIDTH